MLLAAAPVAAQGTPSFGCPAGESRQFDLWVGQWEVTVGTNLAGSNVITNEEQGNQGTYLHLTGGYADNQMRLTGTAPGPDGKPAQQRLTFFRNSDGTFRQLWERSNDRGTTWTVAFDGLYRRK